ncbi:MAG: ribonuclease BN [Bacteroidetes bacterium]|nr:MAG: ribonuclease BN [Bacteroidota bacterium]
MLKKVTDTLLFKKLFRMSKKWTLPGFDGLALHEVVAFFYQSITKGDVLNRANSLSFSFFFALFPSILVFFTIIPYIPVEGFQATLLQTLHELLPDSTYEGVRNTIEEIIVRKNGGLLSVSFLLSIIFSTNGTSAMIDSFNKTHYSIETRSFVKQRLVAFYMVVLISMILIFTITLIIVGSNVLRELANQDIVKSNIIFHVINFSRFLVITSMILLSVSLIYFMAPVKKQHFRFISPGSVLATILFLLTTIGFNYYIQNFSKYNALYGSIGTLIIFMMWINLNTLILLLGFDLNASISRILHNRVVESDSK